MSKNPWIFFPLKYCFVLKIKCPVYFKPLVYPLRWLYVGSVLRILRLIAEQIMWGL